MDFRFVPENLEEGLTNQQEIITQLLNLPCTYGIFQERSQIFCLDVYNKEAKEKITVALLYSSLDIAIKAVEQFKMPSHWNIVQWTEIQDSLKSVLELNVDGVAFDSLPFEDDLTGLIIDKESLKELLILSCSN